MHVQGQVVPLKHMITSLWVMCACVVPQMGNGKAFFRGVAAEHFMYVIWDLLLWSRALVIMDAST